MYINRVITRAVVRNPPDAGRQSVNDLLVEDPDIFGRFVLSVDTYGACVFSSRLAICQEGCAVRSVDVLCQRVLDKVKVVRDPQSYVQ